MKCLIKNMIYHSVIFWFFSIFLMKIWYYNYDLLNYCVALRTILLSNAARGLVYQSNAVRQPVWAWVPCPKVCLPLKVLIYTIPVVYDYSKQHSDWLLTIPIFDSLNSKCVIHILKLHWKKPNGCWNTQWNSIFKQI